MKLIISLVILIATFTSVNSEEISEELKTEFFIASGITAIQDNSFFLLAIRPVFKYMRITADMDIRFLFANSGIRKEDWNELRDLSNLVREIKYENEGLFLRGGNIEEITLGHGLLVKRYYNTQPADFERKFGRQFKVDFGSVGLEDFGNDVFDERVEAVNIFFMPSDILGKSFFHSIKMNGIVISDSIPSKNKYWYDSRTDKVYPLSGSDQLGGFSAGLDFQLIKSPDSDFCIYTEVAQIRDK